MATPIIATAPQLDAGPLHSYAIQALDECLDERDKIYAVAAAGHAFCNEDQNTLKALFQVIQDMLAELHLSHMLRNGIDKLGRAAGVEVQS